MKNPMTLAEEQQAFEAQLDALLSEHLDEYVLFKDGAAVAFFDDEDAALADGLERFGLDDVFLVSRVARPEPERLSLAWELGVMFGGCWA